MASDNPSQILEATESFVCDLDGQRIMVNAGTTRVAAGAAVAKAYPQRFKPIEAGLEYGVEETTAEPGRARQRAQQARPSAAEPTATEPKPEAEAPPAGETKGLTTQSLRRSQAGETKGK